MEESLDAAQKLLDEFFTPEFFKQEELIDKIIACMSLEEFQDAMKGATAENIQGIFSSAAFTDPDAKFLTPDELQRIFNALPSLRGNSDFI
jgi:hypothetical protein